MPACCAAQWCVSKRRIQEILRFTGAAAGPAMLVVLGLRLAGMIRHSDAIVDLIVLLLVGVFSPIALGWLSRKR
jgi:predicted permease